MWLVTTGASMHIGSVLVRKSLKRGEMVRALIPSRSNPFVRIVKVEGTIIIFHTAMVKELGN